MCTLYILFGLFFVGNRLFYSRQTKNFIVHMKNSSCVTIWQNAFGTLPKKRKTVSDKALNSRLQRDSHNF